MKRQSWALLFVVPQKGQIFSVGIRRHVLRTWLAEQSGEKASFLKPLMDTTVFVPTFPAFHLDPRVAKWLLSTRGHVGHFRLSTKKGKEKGFPSKCPSKMGPSTGYFGHCHCSGDVEGNWDGSSRANATAAELSQCDVGFCLYEELNVSLMVPWLYGSLDLDCRPLYVHTCVRHA